MIKNIFVVTNQINKQKAGIYDHCSYSQIIIKKIRNYIKTFSPLKYKTVFCFIEYKNDEST